MSPRETAWVGRSALGAALLGAASCGGPGFHVEPMSLQVPGQSADAAIAVLPGSGRLLLSWIGGDGRSWTLRVSASDDRGITWSAPVDIAGGGQGDELQPHGESSPRLVAAPDGRVALAWVTNVRVEGRKWPATRMRLARSMDGGTTWSAPVTLNDDTTGAPVGHQFHGAAWRGDSALVVAWLDERDGPGQPGSDQSGGEPDAAIYTATSVDFGRTWDANRRLWGAVCPCCRVTLARLADGSVTAAWRGHFPGSIRDVVVAPVMPHAPAPARVHADDWVYPGCPHNGPAAAPARDGSLHVAWYSGKPGASGLFYRRVGPHGAMNAGPLVTLLGGSQLPGAHPAVAGLPDGGALVGYDVDRHGRRVIRLARVSPTGRLVASTTVPGSTGGGYPQLAPLDSGAVALAYTVTTGEVRRVLAAVVRLPTAR
jgi:hypothetical protein